LDEKSMDVAGEGGCDWMGAAGKKVGDVNLVQTKKLKRNGYNIW